MLRFSLLTIHFTLAHLFTLTYFLSSFETALLFFFLHYDHSVDGVDWKLQNCYILLSSQAFNISPGKKEKGFAVIIIIISLLPFHLFIFFFSRFFFS